MTKKNKNKCNVRCPDCNNMVSKMHKCGVVTYTVKQIAWTGDRLYSLDLVQHLAKIGLSFSCSFEICNKLETAEFQVSVLRKRRFFEFLLLNEDYSLHTKATYVEFLYFSDLVLRKIFVEEWNLWLRNNLTKLQLTKFTTGLNIERFLLCLQH